jgi:hypothetical protein
LARRRDQDDVPGERMKRRFHAGRRRSKTFEDGDEATYVGESLYLLISSFSFFHREFLQNLKAKQILLAKT